MPFLIPNKTIIMKTKTILFSILISITLFSCKTPVQNGKQVIGLMKEAYNNTYFENFTFSQNIIEYADDTITSRSVWHEAYTFPSQLVIQFENFESGEGYIFNNDSIYVLNDNKVTYRNEKIHDVIVLGFDVYAADLELTCTKLTKIGYDLSKVCDAVVNGKPAYCVGVNIESERAPKFYIDKEKLCFLKMVTYYDDGGYGEVEFTDYKMVEDYYVATKVLFSDNGKLGMSEEYYDMSFPKELDASIYDPANFEQSKW